MSGRTFESPVSGRQAVGCRKGNHVKVVCAFDEEMFQAVRALAVKHRTSVAEQVRTLVEWGLEADGAAA